MVANGSILSGARIHKSLLSTHVRVNSYSTLREALILPDVDVGRHCRLSKL